jgi:hypothetical protein
MVNDHKHLFEVIPSRVFWGKSPIEQVREVQSRTYLLAGLKPCNVRLLISRIERASSPRSFWSDLTDNHDAIMFGVVIALSGQTVPWTLIRKIRISIVSNLIQGRDRYLLTRKKYLAAKRKSILSQENLDIPLPRSLSWMSEIYSRITDPINSKCYVEKFSTLLNKRSCGIPKDPRVVEAALVEYFESVNQPERDNRPNVMKELMQATIRISETFEPRNLSQAASILLTTSACYERTVLEGGKLSLVREIASDSLAVELFDLNTGNKTGMPATRLADKVLHHCLDIYQRGYDDLYSTRVCALPEIGMKVRIPTCSSFYRQQILQPVSKIYLEALKGVPELQAGLNLERQGWEFYKSFGPGEHEFRREDNVLCSDYQSSTDWIKRSVAMQAFDALGRITAIPKWYLGVVRKLYFQDLVHRPRAAAVHKKTASPSVIDGVHQIKSGLQMGDPITKAMLSFLGLMVSIAYRDPRKGGDPRSKISIVGDDFISVGKANNEWRFKMTANLYGFKVSEPDTFLSAHWAHFTEFCVRIPKNRWESFHSCRVIRHHPCYADSIRPRIIMRCGKAAANDSDPRIGRIKLLAQEMSYIPDNHVSGTMFQIATLWQDAEFGIKTAIPYLPHIFGGMGKVAPPGYLRSLKQDNAIALMYVAKHYTQSPESSRSFHPARQFLSQRVHLNTQLYSSHMGEKTFVNLTNIINMIEHRVDFNAFVVISAAEQAAAGVNLSRVLSHENHYVVTSEKLAERLYIFASVMKEVYGVDVLNTTVLDTEPTIPDEVWGYPRIEGCPDYRILAEDFHPYRTIYLKEVMSLLETTAVTTPHIPLSVDINSLRNREDETDLQEFAKYVRALKGHTDDVRAWMNIPRKCIDDDKIIKHIAKLTYELTGEVPMISTNDRGLLADTQARRFNSFIESDVETAAAVSQWGRDLDDPVARKRALELLAQRAERGPLVSGKAVLLDTANVTATLLGRLAQRDLNQIQKDMVLQYIRGNYPPFESRKKEDGESSESYINCTFRNLAKHLGL